LKYRTWQHEQHVLTLLRTIIKAQRENLELLRALDTIRQTTNETLKIHGDGIFSDVNNDAEISRVIDEVHTQALETMALHPE
jgi:hypothetical protein